MLSRMLAYFVNNLQVIEKLAESRPIRRAAQLTAYALTKAQIVGRDTSERVMRSQTLRQVRQEASRAEQRNQQQQRRGDGCNENQKISKSKTVFIHSVHSFLYEGYEKNE
uniref:NCBP2 antisense 2 (head to head) n=2 Tax=Xiphophorus TaxID=8082 RepID=M4B0J7_XIPMA